MRLWRCTNSVCPIITGDADKELAIPHPQIDSTSRSALGLVEKIR